MAIPLPEGFTLDKAPNPPPGFKIDVPEPPSGFTLDVAKSEIPKPSKLDMLKSGIKSIGDIEPLPEADVSTFGPRAVGALVGAAATFAPSGLAGYAKLLTSGPEEAVKTIEEIQSFFPKKLLPKKHEMEAFEKTPPLWALGKVQEYKTRIGDWTMEKTESPEAGALAATIFEAGVFLGLPWLTKRVGAAIKTKRASNIFALEKDAKVKQALADYEKSKVGMPLLEPDITPVKAEIPGKLETELHPAEVPIRPLSTIEPKVLRPDQEALLKGRTRKKPLSPTEPIPLLKPDTTPVRSVRALTVEERLGKRPASDKVPIEPSEAPKAEPIAEPLVAEKAPEIAPVEAVEPVKAKPEPKVKEPWELSKKEFEKAIPIEEVPDNHSVLIKEKGSAAFLRKDKKIIASKRATEVEAILDHERGHAIYDEVQPPVWERMFRDNPKAWGEFLDTSTAKSHKADSIRQGADPSKPMGYNWIEVSADLHMENKAGNFKNQPNLVKVLDEANPHFQSIKQAIAEGKIESHPDYPDLAKPKAPVSKLKAKKSEVAESLIKEAKRLKIPAFNPATGNLAGGWTLKKLRKAVELKREVAPPPSVKAEKKGTTLSTLGTQGVYEGVAKEVPKLKNLGTKTIQAIQDFGAVEPRFQRHNAPETGFHAKNYFSKWAAWEERTIDKVAKVAKVANYDKGITGVDAVLAIGSEKALKAAPEGVKAVGKEVLDFTENIKKEYAKRGIKLDFKGRIINEIKDLIKNAEDAEVPALEKALKAAEDMQFLHIPSALWIESKIQSPTGGKVLKLLATQKRKSLNVKTLIDQGLVDPKDVNVFDIMASYGRRAGRDFALLDLKDAALKEGLFTKQETVKNIVKIPGYESPIFTDGYMHPVLADYIRGELLGKGLNLGKAGKVFAFTKLSAFINPLILPFYDTMQHSQLALVNKWSRGNLKSNAPLYHLARGAKQFLKRTPEYYEALDNGLASKPFNNPFGTYKNLVEWAKKNNQQKALSVLNNLFDRRAVLNIYRASFETAWNLDQMIRMGSYDLLRKKGFSVRESAQMAARAHSDYASVPASSRRMLNVPFFTPTFKLTMGKFYGTMLADAVKYGKNLGGVLGKVSPKTKVFAGALVGTIIANLAYDQLMTEGFKMKRDEFGRRYTKEVNTDQGKKELTITMSSPINMWQKYVFRAMSSFSPEVAKPWVRFFEQNKWEIQPLFRVAYEVGTNDNGRGDKIYSEFDTRTVATVKALKYATKSIVRLFGLIDRDPSDKEGINRFKKEYGKLTEILLRPITFVYLRTPEEKRIGFKVKMVQNRFNKALRRGEIKQQHIDEYIRQLDQLLKTDKKENPKLNQTITGRSK